LTWSVGSGEFEDVYGGTSDGANFADEVDREELAKAVDLLDDQVLPLIVVSE
jgi:hypothetical protein